MFDLKKPCKNCPFRRTKGDLFSLGKWRIEEIVSAPAFQCHATVDYDGAEYDDDGEMIPGTFAGKNPQQCAGLMALLYREKRPNQIMRVAKRLTGFDAGKIDASDVYKTLEEAIKAHEGR